MNTTKRLLCDVPGKGRVQNCEWRCTVISVVVKEMTIHVMIPVVTSNDSGNGSQRGRDGYLDYLSQRSLKVMTEVVLRDHGSGGGRNNGHAEVTPLVVTAVVWSITSSLRTTKHDLRETRVRPHRG